MLKYLKQNKASAQSGRADALKKAKRTIYWQGGLALLTVALTIVIVFTMTAAWYTNVVQTSGLVIQAESWGFDGQITVNNNAIVAAPGDEGQIYLEVNNTSQSMSAVSVGVSKARMDPQMQQRLYFYVDTQMARNGETMDRVYLNTQDSYTYTLFGGQKLILSEDRHTDVQLKWQWVYDVLGYYVLGSWSEERSTLTAVEYLRPIEYNYDEATTTFRQEGGTLTMELKTVDGHTTVEEFLVALSKTDGYEGQIDPAQKLGSGYYPVAVDADGYGVYAYLCTYADIELATQYDTALAKAAQDAEKNGTAGQRYEAQLIISAQKNDENIINISTLSAMQTAVGLDSGAVIQLTDDIVISGTDKLVIPAGVQVTLDLNGHTITSTTEGNAIEAEPGSSLTMLNGALIGPGNKGRGICAVGAEVICHGMQISKFVDCVYLGDHNEGNTQDSRVRLIACDINADDCAVYISGNGLVSEQKTQLIVENSTLYSQGITIMANGSVTGNGRWGTDIQILHSTVTSNPDNKASAVYHPQKDSTLTVYESTLTGYTSMAIKGGQVCILGSTVRGMGAQQTPNPGMSGYSDTGDGIYIEANYDYEIQLTIDESDSGQQSVISSDNGYALQVFEPDADNVKVRIYSGTFSDEQRAEHLAVGTVQTEKDGTYIVA